ncbi:hypothetical protein B5F87_09175 [Eubacterium sp. An3]|nr:hypothetical protein B5F87_09175 [Eubacterium sp. An3]
MKLFNVLWADSMRWFGRWKMWAVLAGIVIVNYLMMGQNIRAIPHSSVVETVYLYIEDPFFALSLLLAVFLMGTSYCDDLESGYLLFCMERCNRNIYVFSKIIHTFFSAFFVLAAGIFIWICSMRLFMPWAFPQEDYFQTIAEQGMGGLLLKKNYLLYFFLHSLGCGMLGGVVSTATFVISMILKNKMLVQTVAVLLYYINVIFLPSYSPRWSVCSLSRIFYFIYSDINSTWMIVVTSSVICLLLLFIFGLAACKIFERNNYA